jgi:molybdopterin converting factor subunit 1
MEIRLRLFALFGELAGKSKVRLSVPDGTRVKDLKPLLVKKFPALGKHGMSVVFILNNDYADPESELRDGDEIAVIPPVSGG